MWWIEGEFMGLTRYRVQKKIYESKHSNVYKCIDSETGEVVAIKELTFSNENFDLQGQDKIDAMNDMKRFRREYEFLSSIHDENIIKVHEFIESGLDAYIVLEYVDGMSMEDFLIDQIEIPLKQKLQLAIKIGRAVQRLNEHGIVHRDIKPGNIMIDVESNAVKLIDIGIGKSFIKRHTKLTETQFSVGTCAYMSPEQSLATVSMKSDIFSLGVTLYQFFFSLQDSPFASRNPADVLTKVVFEEVTKPAFIDIKKEEHAAYEIIYAITKKAMEKFPHRRWANIKRMTNAVALVLDHFDHTTINNIEEYIPTPLFLELDVLPKRDQDILEVFIDYGQFFLYQEDFAKAMMTFKHILRVFPNHAISQQCYQKAFTGLQQKNLKQE